VNITCAIIIMLESVFKLTWDRHKLNGKQLVLNVTCHHFGIFSIVLHFKECVA